MLLSLAAGGVGLNLVGANHLFLLDMHWNPQLEAQVGLAAIFFKAWRLDLIHILLPYLNCLNNLTILLFGKSIENDVVIWFDIVESTYQFGRWECTVRIGVHI